MHRRALVALALVSCGFDSTGVPSPGGSMASTSASSTASSGESTTSDESTTLSAESSTSPTFDTSSTGAVDDADCNGMPMPMLPTQAGPVSEISVYDVRFSGSASNLAHVQPGATIVLQLGFDVVSCECTECITQAVLGFTSNEWRACCYDATPGCAGASGTAELAVEAPLQPGFYPLAFWRTQEFACNPDAGGPDPDDAIAGLCVDVP